MNNGIPAMNHLLVYRRLEVERLGPSFLLDEQVVTIAVFYHINTKFRLEYATCNPYCKKYY
jgi:hypothetical protein